jgi:hypothetical protein
VLADFFALQNRNLYTVLALAPIFGHEIQNLVSCIHATRKVSNLTTTCIQNADRNIGCAVQANTNLAQITGWVGVQTNFLTRTGYTRHTQTYQRINFGQRRGSFAQLPKMKVGGIKAANPT